MNLSTIFCFIAVVIVIFLIIYIPYYIKFNKKIYSINTNSYSNNSKKLENFQVRKEELLTNEKNIPAQCIEGEHPTVYFEDGHEIERCLIGHDDSSVTTPVINKSDVKLYYFDGKKTHMFIDDFFDNFTKIVLYVKFELGEIDKSYVLIQSKYYKVEWKINDLIYTYNYIDKDTKNHIKHTINNVSITNLNEITIDQSKRDKKIYFKFREFNLNQEEVGSPINYEDNMIKEHKCDYSVDNEIYIGCDRKKNTNSFIKGFIGIKELKINKSKHDTYVYSSKDGENGMTINELDKRSYPTNIPCNITTVQAIWRESDTPAPTTRQTLSIYENYLEIMMNNIIIDLKLFYKESLNIDNTQLYKKDRGSTIFFRKLVPKEDNVSNPARIFLKKNEETKDDTEKKTLIFNGYDNRNANDIDYIGYYFNLNDEYNRKLFNYFDFLDLNGVQNRFNEFDECNMLILGNRSDSTSFYKFLRLHKVVFILVFKNKEDISYNYEIVNINLDRYYYIQQKFYEFGINTAVGMYTHLINFFDSIYDEELKSKLDISAPISDTQVTSTDNFKPNLLSLYSKNPNFNAVFNYYKDGIIENKKYVNYYSDFSIKTCDFKPYGETPFECRQLCVNTKKPNCNLVRCSKICNNCETDDCKWKLMESHKHKQNIPNEVVVKGFSGNGKVKLSWIKPDSKSPIINYYIIVESSNNPGIFDLYVYKGEEDLVEYVINNLNNDIVYLFYVLTNNKYGVSNLSNKITLIPNKDKVLDMEDMGIDTYSDSLQNYYKSQQISINVVEEMKKYKDMIDINELKQVLLEQRHKGLNKTNYNVNIF